jgi:hypothetical protein
MQGQDMMSQGSGVASQGMNGNSGSQGTNMPPGPIGTGQPSMMGNSQVSPKRIYSIIITSAYVLINVL